MSFRYLDDLELGLIADIDDMGPFAKPADLAPILRKLAHLNGVNEYVSSIFDALTDKTDSHMVS